MKKIKRPRHKKLQIQKEDVCRGPGLLIFPRKLVKTKKIKFAGYPTPNKGENTNKLRVIVSLPYEGRKAVCVFFEFFVKFVKKKVNL